MLLRRTVEYSSRYSDAKAFYENLLQNVYAYQNDGVVFICGDLNSRCGDSEDFISGVDCIPMRQVVDYKSNAYGDRLIQFLIDCNMCMLNGGNYICNDFTSISTKGHSVVDYCLVSHDNLQHCTDFDTVHVADMLDVFGIGTCISKNIPDHSVICWKVNIGTKLHSHKSVYLNPEPSFDKFDYKTIPKNFLMDNGTITETNA